MKLTLDGDIEDLVRLLTARRVESRLDEFGTVRLQKVDVPLIGEASDVPNLGLAPIISRYLRMCGRLGENRAESPRILLAPPVRQPLIKGLPAGDDGLLDFIHDQSLGIVRLGDSIDIARLVAEICAANPRATLAIISQSRKRLRELKPRLVDLGVDLRATGRACYGDVVTRVFVGTYFDLGDDPDFNKRHLFIALDAIEAIAYWAEFPLLAPFVLFRLFGFLSEHSKPSPYESDRLMATFGPSFYCLPSHGFQNVTVNVAWLAINSPRLPDEAQPPKVFRRGYWNHHARNRQIAKLALALVAGDQPRIARLAPGAELHHLPQSPPRVAVLVEAIDHAISLAELLPGWPIKSQLDVDVTDLSGRQQQLLAARSCQWAILPNRIISGSCLDLNDFDVVICAGGGKVSPLVSQRPPICPVDQPRQLLVVDVIDRHHPLLHRLSRNRRQGYEERNWFAPDVSMIQGRIDRFLRERCSP